MSESTVFNPSADSGEPAGKFISALQRLTSAIDISGIVESRRKDTDALSAANDVALQGLQNLGHAQAQILKNSLAQAQTLLRRGSTEPIGRSATVRETVTQGVHEALADIRFLAETGIRAQADIVALVGKRVEENFRESAARLQSVK